jgi:hypothetical protein
MILGGLAILGGGWVILEMTSPDQIGVISVSRSSQTSPKPLDPLEEVEAELRSASLGDLHEVRQPGDLGDGILIDLQKLRLDVTRVDAPVTKWVGRKKDDPDEATVTVTFQSAGELDRELGAIGLVVGRYKLKYVIDFSSIEAIWERDGEHKSRLLDQKLAEQFAQSRIHLPQLLGITSE